MLGVDRRLSNNKAMKRSMPRGPDENPTGGKVKVHTDGESSPRIRLGRAEPSRETAPSARTLERAFACVVFLVAAPLFTVPGTRLSFSALAVGVLLAVRLRHGPPIQLGRSLVWRVCIGAFLLGLTASLLWNAWTSGDQISRPASAQLVVQYVYWAMLFVVTLDLVAGARLGQSLVRWGATAAVVVAVFAFAERIVWNSMTAGGISQITRMTVNLYGIQFSTFAPLLLERSEDKGVGRRLIRVALLVFVLAVAIANGSRSSWIALLCAFLAFSTLVSVGRRSVTGVLLSIGMSVGLTSLWAITPEQMQIQIAERAETLERLDRDKSYQVRQLMIQKALILFAESPIVGTGPNNFRLMDVVLAVEGPLRYGTAAHFNEKSAHNSYMLLLAEGGLLSVVPIAALILVLGVRGARVSLLAARQGRTWPSAIYASFIGMSIHLWTLAGMASSGTFLIYGALAGAIELAARDARRGRSTGLRPS